MKNLFVIPRGGLGNVLYNYMIGYLLSKKFNRRLKFISNYPGPRRKMQEYKMFRDCTFVPKIPRNVKRINEQGLPFQKIHLPDPQRDYVLDGYFGSYKYSIDVFEQIKRDLITNHPDHEIISQRYKDIKTDRTTVAIHVRRGDYLRLQHILVPQPDSYYQRALQRMQETLEIPKDKICLILFSDDPKYLTSWTVVEGYDHYVVTEPDPERAFLLMSLCENFIIANSTFSLLAYHFRETENARLIAPKNWYGVKGPKHKMEDLIPISENVELL